MYSLFYKFFFKFLSVLMNFELFMFNQYFCQNIFYISIKFKSDISVFTDISNLGLVMLPD